MKLIVSRDNPRFKEIVRIRRQHAKEPGAGIFIEGQRLCMDAMQSGVVFETVLVSQDYVFPFDPVVFGDKTEILVLSDTLFQRLCSTDTPQGIAAVVKSPVLYRLDGLAVHPTDKYMVCEAVQDPGNLGSIIRTADAFGFAGVMVTRDTVDPFNEKALRSSMGSIFHIKIIQIDSVADTLQLLRNFGITTYAAHLEGTEISRDGHFDLPCAIVVGNEGQGIREDTARGCDHRIKIPMPGKAESLNVSNAAAILCYLASAPVKVV